MALDYGCPFPTCRAPTCGDGIVDAPAECDDRNLHDDDGCHVDCTVPRCGDSRLDPGEGCDDGSPQDDGDGCVACALGCPVAPSATGPEWDYVAIDPWGTWSDQDVYTSMAYVCRLPPP